MYVHVGDCDVDEKDTTQVDDRIIKKDVYSGFVNLKP